MSNEMGPLQVTPETLLSRAQDMVEEKEIDDLSHAIAYVVAEWADETGVGPSVEQETLDIVRELSKA